MAVVLDLVFWALFWGLTSIARIAAVSGSRVGLLWACNCFVRVYSGKELVNFVVLDLILERIL